VVSQDLNRSIVPLRPAGAGWSSARDLLRYVQLELARGKLADGKQWISASSLAARTAPQIAIGADVTYGMGLEVDRTWGVAVVHHGGSMIGYKSDMMWLPDHGVGAVILTNSENGGRVLRPFMRRLLEVLFDGKPEAFEDLAAQADSLRANERAERKRLLVPPDASAVGKLAPHYRNAALGDIGVSRAGAETWFDFGEWKSPVASRKNDDGSLSFVTINLGVDGFEFVVAERAGKRALVLRDAQHEYVFLEQPAS
jgi:CubicO group peptidase (beta-lactamase class C family)